MLIDLAHIILPFLLPSLFLVLGIICLFYSSWFSSRSTFESSSKISDGRAQYLINLRNFVFTTLIVVMTFYPPLVFAGTPVAGLLPDGTTNTGVGRAPNGTPILNIAAHFYGSGNNISIVSATNIKSKRNYGVVVTSNITSRN